MSHDHDHHRDTSAQHNVCAAIRTAQRHFIEHDRHTAKRWIAMVISAVRSVITGHCKDLPEVDLRKYFMCTQMQLIECCLGEAHTQALAQQWCTCLRWLELADQLLGE